MDAPLAVALALAVCLLAPLAAASTTKPSGGGAPGDVAAVRGSWTCTSAVVDGKPLPEKTTRKLKLTLTADRYKTDTGDEVLFDSNYRLDPGHKPGRIEMVGTEGDAAGKPALGIYSLEGDTLRICYTMPGGKRPERFESATGSAAYLIVWKRAKT
jgi:uncharacterized protein (TIGR03067 family)